MSQNYFLQKLASIGVVTLSAIATTDITPTKVEAATFSFFSEVSSVPLDGEFRGNDLNGDRFITQDELTSYEAFFRGVIFPVNPLPPFTHFFDELEFFAFSLDDSTDFNFRSSSIRDGQQTIILQDTSPEGNDINSGEGFGVRFANTSVGTSAFLTVFESQTSIPETRSVSELLAVGTVMMVVCRKKLKKIKSKVAK